VVAVSLVYRVGKTLYFNPGGGGGGEALFQYMYNQVAMKILIFAAYSFTVMAASNHPCLVQ
jgi:hypothetical protein